MLEDMMRIAKSELATINEKADELPAPQVTVLLTNNNNIYVAVNDIDGLICEKLNAHKDTKIVRMLTVWKDGCIDLASLKFRNALIEMDEYNKTTDVLLQGKEGSLVKKLAATMYPR